MAQRFNPPPNWPTPPAGWTPPQGWSPDPAWGPMPAGWQLWVDGGPAAAYGSGGAGIAAVSAPGAVNRPWFARHMILTGLGALVVVILLAQAFGGGAPKKSASGSASVTPAATTPSQEASPPPPSATTEPPKVEAKAAIGTAVADGKFQFTVNAIKCGETKIGDEYLNKTAQGNFCLVDVTVKNIGDVPQTFFGDNQYLFNSAGQKYSADSSAAMYLKDSNSMYEEINPGNSLRGTVVFDIPADAVPASIELHDSAFSGGATVGLL